MLRRLQPMKTKVELKSILFPIVWKFPFECNEMFKSHNKAIVEIRAGMSLGSSLRARALGWASERWVLLLKLQSFPGMRGFLKAQ